MRRAWVVVPLVVSLVVLAGCADAARRGVGSYAEPGLRELPAGRSRAIGTLARVELEGGFWAVKDAIPGEVTDGTANVVVISNPEDLNDLTSLEGEFVVVVGEIVEGVSIRQAGPEMRADSVEPAPQSAP